MSNNSVEYRVKAIVCEVLGATAPPTSEVSSATTFQEMGYDSLDAVEAVMLLEEEFDITICDEDADEIDTIGEMVAYITRRLGG